MHVVWCCRDVPCVTDMCHVLQRCAMCYRDVAGVPGVIDNVLQGCNHVAWCYRDVPGVTYMCLVLHRCASCCIYVLSITDMCQVLHKWAKCMHVAWCNTDEPYKCLMLQRRGWCYRDVSDVTEKCLVLQSRTRCMYVTSVTRLDVVMRLDRSSWSKT